jgi:hypothetical protein
VVATLILAERQKAAKALAEVSKLTAEVAEKDAALLELRRNAASAGTISPRSPRDEVSISAALVVLQRQLQDREAAIQQLKATLHDVEEECELATQACDQAKAQLADLERRTNTVASAQVGLRGSRSHTITPEDMHRGNVIGTGFKNFQCFRYC